MSDTTTLTRLSRIVPESETHWRTVAARAHRLLGRAGDEAAALTHELHIVEIRGSLLEGTSREIRYCPRCLKRGVKYVLIFMGGGDCCGTCYWPRESNDG